MENKWCAAKRLKWGKILAYLGVMVMSLLLSGCGTLQTLVQKDGESSPLSQWIGGTEKNVPATTNLGDGKTVSLYFPDSTGKSLVKEDRALPKTLSLARETVSQWIKGPAVKGSAQAAVAPATVLLDIAIKEGVATVDLSKEFIQPFGKVSQETAVYGLVNTLTQFPTVREVKLRVEGKPLTKLGTLDLSHLSYKEGLVKSTSQGVAPNTGSQGVSPSSSSGVSVPILPATGGTAEKSEKILPDSPSTINLFSIPSSAT